ncbi:15012_t:CDS:2, partial [Dentiscutata heterogama]
NSEDDISNYDISEKNCNTDHQSAINKLHWFSNDLENLLKEDDPALEKSLLSLKHVIGIQVELITMGINVREKGLKCKLPQPLD